MTSIFKDDKTSTKDDKTSTKDDKISTKDDKYSKILSWKHMVIIRMVKPK
jgi:hypothetical protein